jgi:hypothetical protein
MRRLLQRQIPGLLLASPNILIAPNRILGMKDGDATKQLFRKILMTKNVPQGRKASTK